MVAFRVGQPFWDLTQYRDLCLPRNGVFTNTILELWAVQFVLDNWMNRLWGLSVSVQSDNATAVAYINQ